MRRAARLRGWSELRFERRTGTRAGKRKRCRRSLTHVDADVLTAEPSLRRRDLLVPSVAAALDAWAGSVDKFVLKGVAVGIVLGVIAWFTGHGLLRARGRRRRSPRRPGQSSVRITERTSPEAYRGCPHRARIDFSDALAETRGIDRPQLIEHNGCRSPSDGRCNPKAKWADRARNRRDDHPI
jgi:hypothetical protein